MTQSDSGWLRGLEPSDPEEARFLGVLADVLDELSLPALDTARSRVTRTGYGVRIQLAHRKRGTIVDIEGPGEIVVSYGVEHDHFAADDAELGRVWPFPEADHISQAVSFIRYLVTGRIVLHVWRRPFAVKTRSYWIADDGSAELILRGGTIGPFFGWSRRPEIHHFDFTQ